MAQWLGQFTGLTHKSKLTDAEETLRVAVVAFRTSPTVTAKRKAVQRLAARVLNLRVKLIRARRNAYGPVASDNSARLREREQTVLSAGVAGILVEFDAADAVVSDTESGNAADHHCPG